MTVWPLRFRDVKGGLLFADDAGGWFRADEEFLERYAIGQLSSSDLAFLRSGGQAFDQPGDLPHTAFAWRWAKRLNAAAPLNYVILVPTLRCALSCGYCQVSRAALNAKGFDWTEETLLQVIAFLDGLDSEEVKIEFQGGEPTLRLDLLAAVRDFCRTRFKTSQFVVCTSLHDVAPETWAFLDAKDTYVSAPRPPNGHSNSSPILSKRFSDWEQTTCPLCRQLTRMRRQTLKGSSPSMSSWGCVRFTCAPSTTKALPVVGYRIVRPARRGGLSTIRLSNC